MALVGQAAGGCCLACRRAFREEATSPVEAEQRLEAVHGHAEAGAETGREMLRADAAFARDLGERDAAQRMGLHVVAGTVEHVPGDLRC